MKIRVLIGALLLGIGASLAPAAAADPQFPKLTGRVVDGADVIPADLEARLTQKLEALEKQSQRQFVIATVPDLEGLEISDYGYQLGRAWGIGDKERNDGVLLLVAPNQRKVRIEVGYGLEGVLPDGMSFLIINNDIVPRFKANDMPGGIESGANAIIQQLSLPPAQAQQIAAQAVKASKESDGGLPINVIVFGLFFLFFFVLPIIRSMRGVGGQRRGWGGPVVWMPGGFGGGSSGGSSWGGGGGGGGFSGGGGSFGGGGASGSW